MLFSLALIFCVNANVIATNANNSSFYQVSSLSTTALVTEKVTEKNENQALQDPQSNTSNVSLHTRYLSLQLAIIGIIFLGFIFYRHRQLERYNKVLKKSESRYARAVKGAQDGVWDWNIQSNETYFSPKFKELLGFQDNELTEHADSFFTRVHPEDHSFVSKAIKSHLKNADVFDIELRLLNKNGQYRWYRTAGKATFDENGNPSHMAGAISDITRRKEIAEHELAKHKVLELIAKEESFTTTLLAIIEMVESEKNNIKTSILLLEGEHLVEGAAPSLPAEYNSIVNGIKIGHSVGSCGTAAYLNQRVIVSDIQTDPLWADYKDIAAQFNLRSCWSEPIVDTKGKVLGTFAIYQHIIQSPSEHEIRIIEDAATLAGIAIEKYKSIERLRLSSMVYQNSSEAMLVFSADREILSVNPAFTEITGYSEDEVVGKEANILNSEFYENHFYEAMAMAVRYLGEWQGEVKDRRKNGEIYYKWLTVNTIYNDDKSVHRRVALFSDITERKKSEKIIWEQANYDALTGLPNRNMFNEKLAYEIKKSERSSSRFALLLLDLDRFKEVNDTLGHDYGDILLVEAARRIKSALRNVDTVARLGGDEFTVILSELNEQSHIEMVAQKIIDKISQPFHLKDELAYVSVSIGITIFPDDTRKVESLLKNADQAMYEAKNLGRNRYQYFTHSMQEVAQKRMRLASELRVALKKSQFEVYYQPIVEMKTGKVCKAESLVRWNHPVAGLVSPADFVPLAEETGIIIELGEWVLKQSIQQVKIWRKMLCENFQISVNTSPVQYQESSVKENRWLTHFESSNINGDAIVMEITEGMIMDESSAVTDQLIAFRNAGIQVALDDFGTGYSSLSYLKRFDIDYIKVDQAFVKNIEVDENNRALCEAIIVMAHKLNLKVIAEGVETEAQKAVLESIGCDFAQGYLFAKPLPVDEFEAYSKQHLN